MAEMLWTQDKFTKGELSPLMYARTSVEGYYDSLKRAKNIITLPQGAAAKRFGTLYRFNINSDVTDASQVYFKSFQYSNECVYLIVIRPLAIDIYLESTLNASVVTTFTAEDIESIDHTVLNTIFRVCTRLNKPKDLIRAAQTANAITGAATNLLTITNAVTAGLIIPARFTGTTLPTAVPPLRRNRTYFLKTVTSTTVAVYSSAIDARDGINQYTISTAGSSANVVFLNSWTFTNSVFKNLPTFDFTGGYETSTFSVSAASGTGITITRTAGTFNFGTRYAGGVFIAVGGIARITAASGGATATADVVQTFTSTTDISGRVSFIEEPVWSDARGWPIKCSSFQNRAFFANTDSLPNGLWGSAINDYSDFNDIETDDDDAISWLPTSDDISFIEFIVPYRSLTVHTNSGVYSSPLLSEAAITPSNFSLLLQDSTPATNIQPRGIDNQIIIVSGNDVHSMLWQGDANAYSSSIVSVTSEQLIKNPIDEAGFVDLNRAGSRYVFIVNSDGTMAIYQTLITQNVSGWTQATLNQPIGNAYFRGVTSNFDGRCWFLTERELYIALSPIAISAHVGNSLTATGINLPADKPSLVQFTTTGTLPETIPQIDIDTNYYAVRDGANGFFVYPTYEDAVNDTNIITVNDSGTNSSVVSNTLATRFLVEELDFTKYMDCCFQYDGTATSTITANSIFNGMEVLINGDGFGFRSTGNNGEIPIVAHGDPVEVSSAQIGFGIDVIIEPMPLSIAMGQTIKTINITEPKHVRSMSFWFDDTVGGTINGVDIALTKFQDTVIGAPPVPVNGVYKQSIMKGWNNLERENFTLEHYEPFNIRLIGIFYKVEV